MAKAFCARSARLDFGRGLKIYGAACFASVDVINGGRVTNESHFSLQGNPQNGKKREGDYKSRKICMREQNIIFKNFTW